ncbi:MAG: type I restriction enzyme HsdR N-terminal domain-containing protein [Candidatus Methylomirabilia bacterium]
MFNIPKRVSERLIRQIPIFQKILQGAKDRDINETDTVTIIKDVLAVVFGFDKYTEVTSEQSIRGTYCDLALKTDGKVQYLIEVKAVGISLKENHLRQAVNYGAGSGIPWVVLTNGVDWEIYRINVDQQVSQELLCCFNLLAVNPKSEDDQAKLFLVCREGIGKDAIEEYHDRMQSLNRFIVGALVQSDTVVAVVRSALRRVVPGLKVSVDEIRQIMQSEVLKREVVDGDQALEASARLKKLDGKARRKKAECAPGGTAHLDSAAEDTPDEEPTADSGITRESSENHE